MTVNNQAVYNSLWGFERNGDLSPFESVLKSTKSRGGSLCMWSG